MHSLKISLAELISVVMFYLNSINFLFVNKIVSCEIRSDLIEVILFAQFNAELKFRNLNILFIINLENGCIDLLKVRCKLNIRTFIFNYFHVIYNAK